MSRAAIRSEVGAFFREAKIAHIGLVYDAPPELITESAYEENRMGEAVASASGSAAVLVVHIPSDKRQRRALAGRGAVNDTRIYDLALEIDFACASGEAIPAQEDYDAMVDEIVKLIRDNPTLNGEEIWSAGEFDFGVEHQQGQPYTDADGMTVFIPGVVKFQAWEWIAGEGV